MEDQKNFTFKNKEYCIKFNLCSTLIKFLVQCAYLIDMGPEILGMFVVIIIREELTCEQYAFRAAHASNGPVATAMN